MTGTPTPNRGAMIVLAYLWPLALVPLFLDKQDADVQWHARHGLVLMVAELILLLLLTVVATIVSLAVIGAGWLVTVVGAALWLGIVAVQFGILALHAVAIVKALGGGRLLVPAISEFADRF